MSRGGRRSSTSLLTDPAKIQRKIDKLYCADHYKSDIIDEFLLAKMPLHFGGMSDPFANSRITQKSLSLLKIFDDIEYPVVLSTKNTRELVRDETFNTLLGMKNLVIQISFSIFNLYRSGLIEPGVPSPLERLKAIKLLAENGIKVIVRLQPLFPNFLDEIRNTLIPSLGEIGVIHVILEFLKLPVERTLGHSRELFDSLDWDGTEYYKSLGAEKNGREWMIPAILKWELLQPLIEQIHKYGMTFGAGDYGLNHLGDTSCCCGIDKIDGFQNWNKNNFAYWIQNNRTNVIILDESTSASIPTNSIAMYINSHSRIVGDSTIFNYLKDKWNRPGTTNAPDTYLGVVWKGEYDEKGNCVYYKTI
jgi:DNA repair photolyase